MPLSPSALRPVLFVAALLTLSACAGSRPPSGPAGPDTPAPTHPAYETFDAAAFPTQTPAPATTVHEVPPSVMSGRVVVPGESGALGREREPRQVEGFRVQVFSTASRETAEGIRTQALGWWEGAQNQPGAPDEMEIAVVYLQPYYRVRLGAFPSRATAEQALELVRTRYPEAFLVPDLVTVLE